MTNNGTHKYNDNELFKAYKEANGSINDAWVNLWKNPNFPKSKDTWYAYEKRFAWKKRLENIQETIRKKTDGNLIAKDEEILIATTLIIRKYIKKLERMSEKDEDKLTVYDFKNAWEIQRVTQGLPTQVTRAKIDNGFSREVVELPPELIEEIDNLARSNEGWIRKPKEQTNKTDDSEDQKNV